MAELFELTGLDTVRQNLVALPAMLLGLGGIALQQEADAILEASQPLVPVDTGSLRRSGRVDDVVLNGPVVSSGVRYGGREGILGRIPEQYAYIVHENVTTHHPIGQDHYLSLPLFAATSGMLARIAEQLGNAL